AQGFRHRENTTLDDIRLWAGELGAGDAIEISLEGVQFRCAGSTEYVAWAESVLAGHPVGRNAVLASAWRNPIASIRPVAAEDRQSSTKRIAAEPTAAYHTKEKVVVLPTGFRGTSFDFQVFENPISMEGALRKVCSPGSTARLLSTFSRPWITRDKSNAH